jgi:hypothetical protein
MKYLIPCIVLVAVLLAACSKSNSSSGPPETTNSSENLTGLYETKETNYKIRLDLRDDGEAILVFDIRGPNWSADSGEFADILADKISKGFTMDHAKWVRDANTIQVSKVTQEGETPVSLNFYIQDNGDLISQQKDARMFRAK